MTAYTFYTHMHTKIDALYMLHFSGVNVTIIRVYVQDRNKFQLSYE